MKFSLFLASVSALAVAASPVAVPVDGVSTQRLEKRESKWNVNQIINCGNQKGRVISMTSNWVNRPTRARPDVTNEVRGQWEVRRTALVGNAGTGAEWIKVLNSRAFNMYPHEFNCFSDRMYDQWSVYGQLPEVVAYAQDGTHLLFLGWYVPAIQYVPPNMSKYNGI